MSQFEFEPMDIDEIEKEADRIKRKFLIKHPPDEGCIDFYVYKGNFICEKDYDEDDDDAIFDFLDGMEENDRKQLFLIKKNPLGLYFRWHSSIPDKYKKGKEVKIGSEICVVLDSIDFR